MHCIIYLSDFVYLLHSKFVFLSFYLIKKKKIMIMIIIILKHACLLQQQGNRKMKQINKINYIKSKKKKIVSKKRNTMTNFD